MSANGKSLYFQTTGNLVEGTFVLGLFLPGNIVKGYKKNLSFPSRNHSLWRVELRAVLIMRLIFYLEADRNILKQTKKQRKNCFHVVCSIIDLIQLEVTMQNSQMSSIVNDQRKHIKVTYMLLIF